MISPLRALQWVARGCVACHPVYEDLLAFRDGEFGAFSRWCVARHLRQCPRCQEEAEAVEEDVKLLGLVDSGTDAEAFDATLGLERLRKAMAGWESLNRSSGEAQSSPLVLDESWQQEQASELALYLGAEAREVLELRLAGGRQKRGCLLQEAESALREFFGPAAAAAIGAKILYAQTSHQPAAASPFAA